MKSRNWRETIYDYSFNKLQEEMIIKDFSTQNDYSSRFRMNLKIEAEGTRAVQRSYRKLQKRDDAHCTLYRINMIMFTSVTRQESSRTTLLPEVPDVALPS